MLLVPAAVPHRAAVFLGGVAVEDRIGDAQRPRRGCRSRPPNPVKKASGLTGPRLRQLRLRRPGLGPCCPTNCVLAPAVVPVPSTVTCPLATKIAPPVSASLLTKVLMSTVAVDLPRLSMAPPVNASLRRNPLAGHAQRAAVIIADRTAPRRRR